MEFLFLAKANIGVLFFYPSAKADGNEYQNTAKTDGNEIINLREFYSLPLASANGFMR